MRAKISYTVDVDKLPDLIEQLLQDCKDDLGSELKKIKLRTGDIGGTVSDIESLMNKMGLYEAQLQDAINLLVGWYEAVNGINQDQESILQDSTETSVEEEI